MVRSVPRSLLAKLITFWGLSLIIAYVVAIKSSFSIVQIAGFLAMLGTIGIFILQYNQFKKPPTPAITRDEDAEGDTGKEANISSREEPTSDLSPRELRVQNELIRMAFRSWRDTPLGFAIPWRGTHLIQKVGESLKNIDEAVVERIWKLTIDDGFFERAPGGNVFHLTPKAIRRAEAIGEEHQLDENIRKEILDTLFQAYRENPSHSPVSRDELLKALARSETEVDQNVWLLQEKRYVETKSAMGISAGYFSVEITDLGRQTVQ